MGIPVQRQEDTVSESRLSVRVDVEVKKEAEAVFKRAGLSLSSGINTYLRRVVQDQRVPFALADAAPRPAPVARLEDDARRAVLDARAENWAVGAPVALYDSELGRPYLRYPDGHTDYDL
ncbi:MAG: type II toxin-antitoxin system RelB/DinJ family antitoxin [Propionibacteriaceae bacterium]|jgi:DNA-damage-inducible protein J|nr:type II toxin-antitoxin system RelB/DinJ family antitoxin [Propionibacteriaceae bacterium]